MSDNWVVQNLQNALDVWNGKLSEIWTIITQSPEAFRDGAVWPIITTIHGALQAIGYTAYTVPMMRSYPWHCLSWATWVVSRTGLGMASIAVLNGAPALYPGVLISVAILRRVSARNMPVAQTVYSGSKNVANGLIIRQNPLQEWLYSLTGISKEILGRKMVAQIILVSLRGWRMV